MTTFIFISPKQNILYFLFSHLCLVINAIDILTAAVEDIYCSTVSLFISKQVFVVYFTIEFYEQISFIC